MKTPHPNFTLCILLKAVITTGDASYTNERTAAVIDEDWRQHPKTFLDVLSQMNDPIISQPALLCQTSRLIHMPSRNIPKRQR